MSLIAKTMEALRPGAVWSLAGDDVEWITNEDGDKAPNMDNITWDDDREFPTMYEWQAQMQVEKENQENTLYQFMRRKEYPAKDDYLDAIYHKEVNGDDSYLTAYFEKITAVKNKYPKPEQA